MVRFYYKTFEKKKNATEKYISQHQIHCIIRKIQKKKKKIKYIAWPKAWFDGTKYNQYIIYLEPI